MAIIAGRAAHRTNRTRSVDAAQFIALRFKLRQHPFGTVQVQGADGYENASRA